MKKAIVIVLTALLVLSTAACAARSTDSQVSTAPPDLLPTATPYNPTNWVPTTNLVLDAEGFEEVGVGEFMKDSLVYVRVGAYASFGTTYDEPTLRERVFSLLGQEITEFSATPSQEHTQRLGHTAWLLEYSMGSNEDSARCVDLFVAADIDDYWAHVKVPADHFEDYEKDIHEALGTVEIVALPE